MNSDLIAGIGLTRLRVYEQRPAPDGVSCGCAHVHALTDEGYYVIAGEGALELHDLRQGFRSVPLRAGDYLQFPPDTLHRSVSTHGLEVLAVMGNSGLAEHGDARIYFGAEVDADPARFAELVALPRLSGLEGALARRDASIRAYGGLMRWWKEDREAYFSELGRFIDLHRRALAARSAELGAAIEAGPDRWTALARRRLALLADTPAAARSDSRDIPVGSQVIRMSGLKAREVLGMCGVLSPLLDAEDAE
ncbi:MAG: cupin domain-containing protein [Betaproteobacteria bacterium]